MSMSTFRAVVLPVLLVSVLASSTAARASEPAADVLTLRDGSAVLGVVEESSPRALVILVRHAWLREHLPEWAERWEQAEQASASKAIDQRRTRLDAWRRDRSIPPRLPENQDRITPWIDRERERLKGGRGTLETRLMAVRLTPSDVSKVVRRPKRAGGLLRQAWLSGLPRPESMSVDELTGALEGRGFDLSRPIEPSVDSLLPPRLESDAVWLSRRAATEISHDPGLRFLRYQGMLLPDPTGSAPLAGGLPAAEALSALADLLGDPPADALPARLREIAARGRIGALVTQLEIAPDVSMVQVTITFWVRRGRDHWAPSGSRVVRVRPEDLGPDAGQALASDPQITLVFKLVEAIGQGAVAPEVKRRALNIGAAVQKALGTARSAAEADLARLALPVLEPGGDAGAP